MRVVNLATGAALSNLTVPDLLPGELAAAPRGRRMVCETRGGVVIVDVDSGAVVVTIPVPAPTRTRSSCVACLAITPDAQRRGIALRLLVPSFAGRLPPTRVLYWG